MVRLLREQGQRARRPLQAVQLLRGRLQPWEQLQAVQLLRGRLQRAKQTWAQLQVAGLLRGQPQQAVPAWGQLPGGWKDTLRWVMGHQEQQQWRAAITPGSCLSR